MRHLAHAGLIAILLWSNLGQAPVSQASGTTTTQPLRCIAFSPYVAGYNPNTGPHPPPALIDTLLDTLITQTGFRCIMIYGLLNGLDYIVDAAATRGVKVIAIAWLDLDNPNNAASIAKAIEEANQHPTTIIRLSCGSEIRTRFQNRVAEVVSLVQSCVSQMKTVNVAQPVGYIDTWWMWCDASSPCQQWSLQNNVDWIGINIFAWWENKFSGLYPCVPAEQAPAFTVTRYQELRARYPAKDVLLTEFGWPAGPEGYKESNIHTSQMCGVAGEANQHSVIETTLRELDQLALSAVLFEAFREPWKSGEGPVGPYWGICAGIAPYTCKFPYGLRQRVFLPSIVNNFNSQWVSVQGQLHAGDLCVFCCYPVHLQTANGVIELATFGSAVRAYDQHWVQITGPRAGICTVSSGEIISPVLIEFAPRPR
jgi:exo-beta-1,3-glucanase (GH17 family)